MKKIYSLCAALLMAGSMMAADEVLFSMALTATQTISTTGTEAAAVGIIDISSYVNTTASTALTSYTYYQGQAPSSGAVKFIEYKSASSCSYLRFTGNASYLEIELSKPLQANDVISFTATDYAVELGFSTAVPTKAVANPATSDKTYTVTAGDAICGQSTIYVNRATNSTAGFTTLTITRPNGEEPKSKFYDFESTTKADTVWTDSIFANGVHAYSESETENKNLMMIKEVKRSYDTHSFTKALYFAGSPKGNARYATVALDGPCTVTVYAMSSTNNASTTRSLYLSVGSLSDKTEVIRHTTDGSSQQIQKGTFVYNGTEATDLYFSVDGGFYLFGFEVAKQYFVTTHDDYATFCAPVDVVLPDALKAYAATEISEQWIHLEQMTLTENKLAANTPVVLMSEEDGTYALDMTENAESAIFEGTNLLMGTVDRIQNPGNVFCLNSVAAAFQQYTGAYIPANKAYLQDATITAASVRIALGPTVATSVENIESVSVKKIMVNGRIHVVRNGNHYNLEGKVIQ